jgi:hypothetical protein
MIGLRRINKSSWLAAVDYLWEWVIIPTTTDQTSYPLHAKNSVGVGLQCASRWKVRGAWLTVTPMRNRNAEFGVGSMLATEMWWHDFKFDSGNFKFKGFLHLLSLSHPRMAAYLRLHVCTTYTPRWSLPFRWALSAVVGSYIVTLFLDFPFRCDGVAHKRP